jgi:excisionase family DNA binding protein
MVKHAVSPPEGYVLVDEAAELLGVSKATIYRWQRMGRLNAYAYRTGTVYACTEIETLRDEEEKVRLRSEVRVIAKPPANKASKRA